MSATRPERHAFAAALWGCVALSACGESSSTAHVAWPGPDMPVAFLFERTGAEIKAVHGPFRVPSDPIVWPRRDGTELVLVGLTSESLRALHPRVDLEAPLERFILEASPGLCARGRVIADDERTFGLEGATLEVADISGSLDATALDDVRDRLGAFSLHAPLSRTRCQNDLPRASLFGSDLEFLPPGTVIDGIARFPTDEADYDRFFETHHVEWITAGAVAVSTDLNLFWVERGRPIEETLDRRLQYDLSLPAPSVGKSWACRALVRAPHVPDRLVVGLTTRDPVRSALLVLDLSQGRFDVVSSSVADGFAIRSIGFDDAGRMLVGGDEGRIASGSLERGLTEFQSLPGEATNVDYVMPVASSPPSFLAGTAGGSVYFVPWPKLDDAFRVSLPGDPTAVTNFSQVGGDDAKRLLVLRATSEPTYSDDGEVWSADLLELPTTSRGCASVADACGERRFADLISASTGFDDSSFVLAPRRCNAAFRYEPESRCIEPIPLPGQPTIGADENFFWWDARVSSGHAIMVSERARLIEVTP